MMELKAPPILCTQTSGYRMNIAKLLSNMEFEVRGGIRSGSQIMRQATGFAPETGNTRTLGTAARIVKFLPEGQGRVCSVLFWTPQFEKNKNRDRIQR